MILVKNDVRWVFFCLKIRLTKTLFNDSILKDHIKNTI
jgi:hypothetical protein